MVHAVHGVPASNPVSATTSHVAVGVGVGVNVAVDVAVAVLVGVNVLVGVGDAVKVLVGVAQTTASVVMVISQPPAKLPRSPPVSSTT